MIFRRLRWEIWRWLRRDAKLIAWSLAVGVMVSLFAGAAYSENTQKGISSGVMRFHVRANSNSQEDQFLKLAVKTKILDEFEDELYGADGLDDSKEIIFTNIPNIKQCAENEIKALGYDYPVKVSVVSDYFPTKHYGGVSLPAGEYDALRVDIGDAEGDNWWCVMYPPLCYVEAGDKLTDDTKEKFKNTLGEREYELVTLGDGNETPDIKIKFKIVELWQKIKGELKNGEPESDMQIVANY